MGWRLDFCPDFFGPINLSCSAHASIRSAAGTRNYENSIAGSAATPGVVACDRMTFSMVPQRSFQQTVRRGALGGAAITTMVALLVTDRKLGVTPNVVFLTGMAAVGAMTGAALSLRNG